MNGVNRYEIPQLLTHRLLLRGFTPGDAEPLRDILAEPDILRYFPRTEPWSLAKVERWLEGHWSHWFEHSFGWWAVADRQNEQLLGWCGLCILDETGEVEVKYLLGKSSWGQGLATEAARVSHDGAAVDGALGRTERGTDRLHSSNVDERGGGRAAHHPHDGRARWSAGARLA